MISRRIRSPYWPFVVGLRAPALRPIASALQPGGFRGALAAGKPIFVHVTAGWCPTCRAQKAVLAKLENDPRFKDILVFDVDFDAHKPAVAAFKARSQSTLVVFKGGLSKGRARSADRSRRHSTRCSLKRFEALP